jgi:hypothetical protein
MIMSSLKTRLDAFRAVSSFFCQWARVKVLISIRRFSLFMVSSLPFVIVYIFMIITVIRASSVSGFL